MQTEEDVKNYRRALAYRWIVGDISRREAVRAAGPILVEGFFGVLPTREVLKRILDGTTRADFLAAQGLPADYSLVDAQRICRDAELATLAASRMVRLADVLSVIWGTDLPEHPTERENWNIARIAQGERGVRVRIAAAVAGMEAAEEPSRDAAALVSESSTPRTDPALLLEQLNELLFVSSFAEEFRGKKFWSDRNPGHNDLRRRTRVQAARVLDLMGCGLPSEAIPGPAEASGWDEDGAEWDS